MQTLQRILPKLLAIGAAGVVLAIFFSDHKADYGEVTLPAGGVVNLPEGLSTIYVGDIEAPIGGEIEQVTGSLAFAIEPVGAGEQPVLTPPGGSDDKLTRSTEALANKGAVADVEVAEAGDYRVSGSIGNLQGVGVSFGRSAFGAVVDSWKLWGGLLLAAVLITILPKRRHTPTGEGWQRPDDESPAGDPVQPSAVRAPGVEPYRG